MKTYKLQAGPHTFDVQEYIRDIQIIYEGITAKEIQVWTGRNYSLAGFPIKSDPPACTVIKLGTVGDDTPEAGEEDFGPVGITLSQALTLLGVIGSVKVSTPDGATEIQLPEVPSGIGTRLGDLAAKESSYHATLDELVARNTNSAQSLAVLNDKVTSTSDMLGSLETEIASVNDELFGAKLDKQAQLDALDRLIAEKTDTVGRLDAAIKEKSEISTRMTLGTP